MRAAQEEIRATLLDWGAGEPAATQLAEGLAHLAITERIPEHAALAWLREQRGPDFRLLDFLAWSRRYHLSSAAALTPPGRTAAPRHAPSESRRPRM